MEALALAYRCHRHDMNIPQTYVSDITNASLGSDAKPVRSQVASGCFAQLCLLDCSMPEFEKCYGSTR